MQAYKVTTTIPQDRTLVLHLPMELPEGDAEVIVLIHAPRTASGTNEELFAFLDELHRTRPGSRTKEEIDDELHAERKSWE